MQRQSLLCLLFLFACGDDGSAIPDAASAADASAADTSAADASSAADTTAADTSSEADASAGDTPDVDASTVDAPADAPPLNDAQGDAVDSAMTDAPPDAPVLDAGPDAPDATHAHAAMAADRLRAAEIELTNLFCECEVAAGNYANLNACVADNPPRFFANDAHVACVQRVVDSMPAQLVTFDCQVDSYDEYAPCLTTLDCTQRAFGSPGFQACATDHQSRIGDCGELDAATSDAILACAP